MFNNFNSHIEESCYLEDSGLYPNSTHPLFGVFMLIWWILVFFFYRRPSLAHWLCVPKLFSENSLAKILCTRVNAPLVILSNLKLRPGTLPKLWASANSHFRGLLLLYTRYLLKCSMHCSETFVVAKSDASCIVRITLRPAGLLLTLCFLNLEFMLLY